jgi:hypothetical protein
MPLIPEGIVRNILIEEMLHETTHHSGTRRIPTDAGPVRCLSSRSRRNPSLQISPAGFYGRALSAS